MQRGLIKRARALIVSECANSVDSGFCVIADMPCAQIDAMKTREEGQQLKLCGWFRDGVLPLDAALQAELTGKENSGGGVRKCAGCGQSILAASNRQRYCKTCGEHHRRRNHARYVRSSRAR